MADSRFVLISQERADAVSYLYGLHAEWGATNDSVFSYALANHALFLFRKYKDLFQTACAYRTLGELYFDDGDYEQSHSCFLHARSLVSEQKKRSNLSVSPWNAAISEKLSLTYSALGDKESSYYYRNIYLDLFAIPATIFWLVGVTNTVNLIDGLDGLAAGVATIASITIFLVALEQNILLVAVLTAALAGAAIGFLYYNFNPARIFMGDTGSMFLGFILASISIIGAVKSAATIALIVPILALGLPIFDTTFAIVRRYRGGVSIFKPDKGHLHHRLLALGFTQRQAVLLMYVISALLGLSAVALTEVDNKIAVAIVFFVVGILVYGAKRLGILQMQH